jgi:energy-coupling factor transporter ATP-binding protein EcfA2
VPKREYALSDVNLSFGHVAESSPSPSPSPSSRSSWVNETDNEDDDGVVLLVGRSASGKSSLLRLLAGTERPVGGGRVIVGGDRDASGRRAMEVPGGTTAGVAGGENFPPPGTTGAGTARPVVLDGKPDFDDSLTVVERIVRAGLDAVSACGDDGGRKRRIIEGEGEGRASSLRMRVHDKMTARDESTLLRTLAEDVATLLTLTDEQRRSLPSELRPSSQYLFGIACACMTSMAPCVAVDPDGAWGDGVRYPIILMDELFDAEHPSIAENCGAGIRNLIRAGGVVVSATHRPGHFRGMASRTITLSGGRVLTDERIRLYVR